MQEVVMYCTEICPYCQRAESLLKRKGVTISKLCVDGNRSNLKEMIKRSGLKAAPQIFIGNHHVGEFDNLSALDITGALDEILAD